MAAPTYLVPQYITYDMVKGYLSTITVYTDPLAPAGSGMYIEDLNTQLANAEVDVFTNILSNYLFNPLQATDGTPFNSLATYGGNAQNAYITIRRLFINCGLYFIFKTQFASGGNANGQTLTQNALDQYNADKVAYSKLDNVTNPQWKNLFAGMKLVANYSPKIPGPIRVPYIPTGEPQVERAISAIPDFTFGFNR